MFSIGYKRSLEEDDMYNLLPEDSTEHLSECLHRCDIHCSFGGLFRQSVFVGALSVVSFSSQIKICPLVCNHFVIAPTMVLVGR